MKKQFLVMGSSITLKIVIYNVKLAVSIYIELGPPFPEGDPTQTLWLP